MTAKFHIPEIDDEQLAELAGRIKPLVRSRENALAYIVAPSDLRTEAFMWDPKLTRAAEDLELIASIPTLHRVGLHGFFQPRIAEVVAQIPGEYLERVAAFETLPPDARADLQEAFDAGFHVGTTRLYARLPGILPSPVIRSAFLERMEFEWHANTNKGDWRTYCVTPLDIAHEMASHFGKLMMAIGERSPERVSEYAADVALIAMKAEETHGQSSGWWNCQAHGRTVRKCGGGSSASVAGSQNLN